MTLKALTYAYVFGGLTFIPLLLAAILIPAWLLLPRIDNESGRKRFAGAARRKLGGKEERLRDSSQQQEAFAISDEAASGTFAVVRKYDYPAAIAALNARNNSANAGGGVVAGDAAVEANNGSESVYQSMYRSVFDRNKTTAGSRSVMEAEDATVETNTKTKKNITPANVYYIVLRHGHLMLYDSVAQMDVRHVISLAHHSVSLSGGGPLGEEQTIKDGDLFIKRTAIVLTPVELPNGSLQSRTSHPKPFYLFSTTSSEKEDFYHALLYTRTHPPIPETFDTNHIIKLQSTLHSTSLTPETRALNALLSRIFLALYHTDRAKSFIQHRIEKKISRVQKPAFIASLAVQSIDLGDAAPVLSNPRLKDLNINGDMTIACDVRYTGGIKITISALAKLDLGPRFKTRTADLVLASSLQRLSGHLLVRIKPPPSNRLWFCFDGMPEMEIRVEPVVSQRQITYTFILRAIEDRIRSVVAETLVKPNWDDITFFDTRGQSVRGGIWRDEGGAVLQDEVERELTAGNVLRERNEKTSSMPALPTNGADPDSSATSSGSETTAKIASGSTINPTKDTPGHLKRRSVASLPPTRSTTSIPSSERSVDSHVRQQAAPPRPLRSPSFAASAPSVALDESPANVDPAHSGGIQAQQGSKKWRIRSAANQLPSRREAVDAMREVRDRAWGSGKEAELQGLENDESYGSNNADSGTADETTFGIHGDATSERRISDTPSSQPSILFANSSLRSPKRTDSSLSTATTSTTRTAQQRKNLLAATTAATTAARNWGWNALANAKQKRQGNSAAPNTHAGQGAQPMGRGQPLPPPGVPLPGPNKGWTGALGGLGSVKRKPVLPARRAQEVPGTSGEKGGSSTSVNEVTNEDLGQREHEITTSDEFGPWRQNSGIEEVVAETAAEELDAGTRYSDPEIHVAEELATPESLEEQPATTRKKVPPPLPRRRDTTPSTAATELSGHDAPSCESTYLAEQADSNSAADHGSSAPITPLDDGSEPQSLDPEEALQEATPAQNDAQAEAKFVLGAEVSEEDFEHEREPEAAEDEVVAIPAPIENDDAELGTLPAKANGPDQDTAKGDVGKCNEVTEEKVDESEALPMAAAETLPTLDDLGDGNGQKS